MRDFYLFISPNGTYMACANETKTYKIGETHIFCKFNIKSDVQYYVCIPFCGQ